MNTKRMTSTLIRGLGGALMGGALGLVVFWPLAAAGVVAGTVMAGLSIAALPAALLAYREGSEAYNESVRSARLPEIAQEEVQWQQKRERWRQREAQAAMESAQAQQMQAPQAGAPSFVDQINARRAASEVAMQQPGAKR